MLRPRPCFVALAVLATTGALGCGGESRGAAPTSTQNARPAEKFQSAKGSAPAPAHPPLVVFLGDSLTAGYGVDEDQAYPAIVGERLRASGIAARVVNAGVSGDTTAGGLARLDWLLKQRPDVLVVGLGANDGLRGLPLEMTEANLRAIVERARAAGAKVLLLGMLIPPNYGPDYARGFAALYPRLAAELHVPLVPFLLDRVAAEPDLNQADGIHPTAAGHKLVAENVLPYLEKLLPAPAPG